MNRLLFNIILLTQAFSYCLIKNALPAERRKELLGVQEFVGISTNAPTPEVGQVKYLVLLGATHVAAGRVQ